jgi:hypothetical protein
MLVILLPIIIFAFLVTLFGIFNAVAISALILILTYMGHAN